MPKTATTSSSHNLAVDIRKSSQPVNYPITTLYSVYRNRIAVKPLVHIVSFSVG
jgi:hypothetical protein